MSRVLVTGGAGFIGSHLVNRLMGMGCFVRVVDNLSSGSLENVKSWLGDSRFEFVRGDLKDLEFRFTGGVDGGRGWRGDVKTMLLSVDRLLSLGWRPRFNSEEAVRLSCRELLRSIRSARLSV